MAVGPLSSMLTSSSDEDQRSGRVKLGQAARKYTAMDHKVSAAARYNRISPRVTTGMPHSGSRYNMKGMAAIWQIVLNFPT